MFQLRPGILSRAAVDAAAGGAAPSPPLDGVASLTGAWSLSRNMLTAFGGSRYTDTAGAIIALSDQSGNSRHMTDASTAGNRPALGTLGTNNITAANFDGSSDILQSVGFSLDDFIDAGSGAVVMSVSLTTITSNTGANYNNHTIFGDQFQYAGLYARLVSGTTPTVFAYNYDGNEDYAGVTVSAATPYVLMWRHHGGNLYVSKDGGSETSSASGNTNSLSGPFRFGGPSVFCDMTLGECFTTSDGSQTSALAAAITNMKTHAGI